MEKKIAELTKEYKGKMELKQDEIKELYKETNQQKTMIEKQQAEIDKLTKLSDENTKKIKSLTEQAGDMIKMQEDLKNMTAEFKRMEKEHAAASEKFREEQMKRRDLLNELEDIKGKIRVYCRIRPFSKSELEEEDKKKMSLTINDQLSVTVHGRFDN